MNVPVPNTNEAPNVDFKLHSYEEQHVCPNCGRCPCCGRGGYQFQPWPRYPAPYIGDVPGWMQWGPTCGTATSTPSPYTMAGGIGAASAQPNY